MQIIFFFLPTEFSSSIVNFCCCCKKGEKYFKKNRGRGKDSPRAENLHKAGLPFQRRNGSRRAHAAAPLGIRNKRHARGLHKGRGTDSIALHRDQHPRPPSGYRGKPAAGGTHGPSLAQGPRPPRQYSPRRSRAKWLKDCIRRPSGLRALHPNSSAPARPQAPRAGGVALEESGPEQRTGPQDAALAPLPPAGDQGLSGPPAPPQPPQPPPPPASARRSPPGQPKPVHPQPRTHPLAQRPAQAGEAYAVTAQSATDSGRWTTFPTRLRGLGASAEARDWSAQAQTCIERCSAGARVGLGRDSGSVPAVPRWGRRWLREPSRGCAVAARQAGNGLCRDLTPTYPKGASP